MAMSEYSLSDMAAVANNEGFGGNSAWVLIILFALIFGCGGNGFGFNRNNELNQYATAASQQEILFGQQFQGINNKIEQVGNGLCDGFFTMNNAVNGVGTQVLDSKYDNALRIDNLSTQMQQCCCGIERGIDGVNYNAAINTAAINANIDAKFAAMEKGQLERELATANNRISALEMDNRMFGVVRYPNGFTYTAGNSPFCGCNSYCNSI